MSHSPPTTFTDSQGRVWRIVVNLGHVAEIQSIYSDFNLARIVLADSPEHARLAEDTSLLGVILQVVLGKQLREQQVAFAELLESMGGSEADDAMLALLRGVANFTPSRAMKQSARLIETQWLKLRQIDRECGAALEAAINSGMSSTSAPPGPESIPGATAFGNWSGSPTLPPGGGELPPGLTPEPFPLSPAVPALPVSTP